MLNLLLSQVFKIGNLMERRSYYESNVKKKGSNNPLNGLKDLGYEFQNGRLRDTKSGRPFEFNKYKTHEQNQRHYDKIGELVEKYVYQLLEKEGLRKATIPVDARYEEGKGFIFHSDDIFNCDKLILIINGSGVVRAGQWSRRVIINQSVDAGSQLPYVKRARQLGFGVIVLNTNQNYDEENDLPIRGSRSPQEHFNYVWRKFVERCETKRVAIVAHSAGGAFTISGALSNPDVVKKTFAVALTDSVHGSTGIRESREFLEWMTEHVCNWASSTKCLDTQLLSYSGECKRVSAGTTVHEETSWKAFESVWCFILRKLRSTTNQKSHLLSETAAFKGKPQNKREPVVDLTGKHCSKQASKRERKDLGSDLKMLNMNDLINESRGWNMNQHYSKTLHHIPDKKHSFTYNDPYALIPADPRLRPSYTSNNVPHSQVNYLVPSRRPSMHRTDPTMKEDCDQRMLEYERNKSRSRGSTGFYFG